MMQSKYFLMFLSVVILFFFFNMFSLVGKMEETGKNRKIIEDKITELEKSKEKFDSDINKLKTEKGVEESIREKFGLAKDGENLILVIDDKDQTEIELKSDFESFWSNVKSWFK